LVIRGSVRGLVRARTGCVVRDDRDGVVMVEVGCTGRGSYSCALGTPTIQ
jgi:hypothetical protein